MKMTKDFSRIQSTFPDATFHRNSSGPGTLIYLDKNKKVSLWYQDKLYYIKGELLGNIEVLMRSKLTRPSVLNRLSKSKVLTVE